MAYLLVFNDGCFVMFSEPIASTAETEGQIRADDYEAAYEEEPEEDRTSLSF